MWCIIYGDPVYGLKIIGPFSTEDDAIRYADQHIDTDWWQANLEAPQELSKDQAHDSIY